MLSTVILCLIDSRRSWLIAACAGVFYQYLLTSCGISNYLLQGLDGSGGRQSGIMDANREGLYSCIGYLAIYFAGVQLGIFILRKRYLRISVISFLYHLLHFYKFRKLVHWQLCLLLTLQLTCDWMIQTSAVFDTGIARILILILCTIELNPIIFKLSMRL